MFPQKNVNNSSTIWKQALCPTTCSIIILKWLVFRISNTLFTAGCNELSMFGYIMAQCPVHFVTGKVQTLYRPFPFEFVLLVIFRFCLLTLWAMPCHSMLFIHCRGDIGVYVYRKICVIQDDYNVQKIARWLHKYKNLKFYGLMNAHMMQETILQWLCN